MEEKSLLSLSEGDIGSVCEINTELDIARRLIDLGLIKNSEIKCLHLSPFGGIGAYDIQGAVIAIRSEDAEKIIIY